LGRFTTEVTGARELPSLFVRGSWSSDGTDLTIRYELVDVQGKMVATSSRSGPLKDFSDLREKATSDLADALSEGKWNSQLPKVS
jgi:hypothetical protein